MDNFQKMIPMNFIIWNVRGVNATRFKRHCKELIKVHKPSMLILLKKMKKHSSLEVDLELDNQIQTAGEGLSIMIVVMWKEEAMMLDILSFFHKGIHTIVKVSNSPKS